MSPDTTVAHAADMMREQGLRRLPVIEMISLSGLLPKEQWQKLVLQKQRLCQFMR